MFMTTCNALGRKHGKPMAAPGVLGQLPRLGTMSPRPRPLATEYSAWVAAETGRSVFATVLRVLTAVCTENLIVREVEDVMVGRLAIGPREREQRVRSVQPEAELGVGEVHTNVSR